MRQQSIISRLLGIVAVFVFFNVTPLQSQQKISIKDGDAPVGHFFVEILHNMPGAPMKSFLGTGGEVEVEDATNNFILRMQNFVWYNPDETIELSFDTDKINTITDCVINFERQGEVITLKPVKSYIRDMRFSVTGTGEVKLSIPFSYPNGSGRFLQDFTIGAKKDDFEKLLDSKKKLRSKDVRTAWNKVDTDDAKSVAAFIMTYKGEKVAKKQLKKAEKALEDLIDKEAEAKFNQKEKEVTSSTNEDSGDDSGDVRTEEKSDVVELSKEQVVDDIKDIVDTLGLNESNEMPIQSTGEGDLYLVLNDENIKKISVGHNKMPLQMQFYEVGQKEAVLINRISVPDFLVDTTIRLDKALLKENKLKGEFSTVDVFDTNGDQLFSGNIDISTKKSGGPGVLTYILGLSALLLGFGLFVVLSGKNKEKKRQEKKKEFTAKIKENLAQTEDVKKGEQIVHSDTPKPVANGKIKIGLKPKAKGPEITAPVHSVARTKSNSRIKITKRKTSGIPIEMSELLELKAEMETVDVDLSTIWDDSIINKVYLAPEFISSLDNFLAESSNDGIQNELQGAIPEVGGFMMGRFAKNKDHIEVLVEKFVPFIPEYNDVFKIEIGTKTLVDELGDAQDKNPKLEVIGWFHTHPGHGLFLSTSDLSVQRHFPNDYQVAMEIDSLTSGLDMSIFSRKFSGRMNNSNDRKSDAWFQWVEIDNSNVK